MCWSTEYFPEKRTADKNIPIIKAVVKKENAWGNTDLSPIFPYYMTSTMTYELNKTYVGTIGKINEFHMSVEDRIYYWIDQGFHSYHFDTCSYSEGIDVFERQMIYIKTENGYEDIYEKKLMRFNFASPFNVKQCDKLNSFIIKGYIPKGSEYYKNERGEIVSDSIVLTEIIKE